jgi:DNA-binding response OmpR family regulator
MPKKILIVDDELNVVRVIAARLKASNYDVVSASDGLYAVQKAHQEKPDLIILDIRMPVGGGRGVFENLRMTSDTMMIPVIFITAFADDDLKRTLLEMGAVDFVTKPFNADELLEKVKKALKEDAGEKEAQPDGKEDPDR